MVLVEHYRHGEQFPRFKNGETFNGEGLLISDYRGVHRNCTCERWPGEFTPIKHSDGCPRHGDATDETGETNEL